MDVVHAGRIDINSIVVFNILSQANFVIALDACNSFQKSRVVVVFFKLFEQVQIINPVFANFLKKFMYKNKKYDSFWPLKNLKIPSYVADFELNINFLLF